MKLDIKEENPTQALLWPRSEKRLWQSALFIGCVLVYATRTVMPLCVVAMAKELAWGKTDSGTVLSTFFWGYALTQVIGGYLSDRIGGDTVMMTAGVGWGLITFWTPKIVYFFGDKGKALALISISRILIGALQGVHFPAITSVVSQKIPLDERAFGYASITAGGHVGTLLVGSIGSVLLDRYGWQCPFYVFGILSMGWVLYMKYYLMEREKRRAQILSLRENISSQSPIPQNTSVPWLTLFKNTAFWACVIAHVSVTFTYFILLSWLPTYFHDTFPDAKGWVFNVVPWVVGFPAVVVGGMLADKLIAKDYSVTFVRKLLEGICLCGQAFFLLCLGHVSTFPSALFCMAMAIACGGFHNSGVLMNPQDIAPKYSGSVFGLMNTAGAIPGFVGVYIAGYILDTTGSWTVVFNVTSVVCIFGYVVFLIFGTGKKIV